MRSLFGRGNEEAPSAPAVTESGLIDLRSAAAKNPEAPPPPGPEKGVGDQMFEAMDRAALKLISILENEDKLENGEMKFSLAERMKAFEAAERWLKSRAKYQPDAADDEGVAMLRKLTEDPAGIVDRLERDPVFITALKRKGWLPPPTRRPGRPTDEAVAERKEYEARQQGMAPEADDSELRGMINGV